MSERYQIKAKIGQGGIGAVYRAFDTHLQREVAVKRLLPPDESEAFDDDPTKTLFKEAHLLSALQHPNVVSVYDVGTDDDGVFVVMELVDGETFDQVVERGLLTEEDFAEMVAQTLEALIAAQDKNLVHRDIKPTNLMVKWLPSGKFQFKLLDFGLAKFSPKPTRQTIGLNDAILGSIHFMAPEQFERLPLDCRTDLYAIGCMFYYGLSGRYPFDGDTAAEVMAAHLQHRVSPLQELRPDVSKRTSDWVAWLMSRDMNHRPHSAQEALEVFFNPEIPVPGSISTPKLILPNTPGRPLLGGQPPAAGQATQAAMPAARLAGQPAATVAPASAPVRLGSAAVRPVSGQVRVAPGRGATGPAPSAARAAPPPPVEIEDAAPQVLHHFPRQQAPAGSPVKKWTIISLASAALILGIGSFLLLSEGKEKKEYRQVVAYVDSEDTGGDGNWVRLLVPYLNPGTEISKWIDDRDGFIDGVQGRLIDMQGEGVDEALVDALPKTSGMVQERLITIVARREIGEAVNPLTAIALGRDPNNARRAIEALSVLGDTRDAGTVMQVLMTTDDGALFGVCENMLGLLIGQSARGDDLVPVLERGLDADNPIRVQQATLRLLGQTGAAQAASAINRVLESGRADLELAAITALREWPDDTQVDRLGELADKSKSENVRNAAYETYVRVLALNQDRKREPQQLAAWWQKARLMADSKRRKLDLVRGLANVPEPFALQIVTQLLADSDADVKSYATQAKLQIESAIRKAKPPGA
jgi:hypothetical protein